MIEANFLDVRRSKVDIQFTEYHKESLNEIGNWWKFYKESCNYIIRNAADVYIFLCV